MYSSKGVAPHYETLHLDMCLLLILLICPSIAGKRTYKLYLDDLNIKVPRRTAYTKTMRAATNSQSSWDGRNEVSQCCEIPVLVNNNHLHHPTFVDCQDSTEFYELLSESDASIIPVANKQDGIAEDDDGDKESIESLYVLQVQGKELINFIWMISTLKYLEEQLTLNRREQQPILKAAGMAGMKFHSVVRYLFW